MNEDIMEIANTLIYNNRLKCGTPEVARSSLTLPHLHLLPSPHLEGDTDWLRHALQPTSRVLFLNTDELHEATEEKQGGGIVNHTESLLLRLIVSSIVRCGLSPSKIGIIAPYRAQIRNITKWANLFPDLEVSTIDRYQGRDKDVILLSFCSSNDAKSVGRLLCDRRRLNVAFTRAKKKLIMVGSVSTLRESPFFQSLFELLFRRKWVYDLPKMAENFYSHAESELLPNIENQTLSDNSSHNNNFQRKSNTNDTTTTTNTTTTESRERHEDEIPQRYSAFDRGGPKVSRASPHLPPLMRNILAELNGSNEDVLVE
jgi:DNA replication ATP-dependent helicase Dna2